MLKKLLRYLLFFVVLTFSSLLLLELSYRFQLIDFYNFEFNSLNKNINKKSTKNSVLIFGDSFSAFPNGYVDQLRIKNPESRFINAAIPGTGIREHSLFFKDRIDQFDPDHIIYQLYIGNDFLDIHHPINYQKLSLLRNLFWQLSEKFLVLKYLNFKLAVFNPNNDKRKQMMEKPTFSAAYYNRREKINFLGNPDHLGNCIHQLSEAKETYSIWKNEFDALLNLLPDSTQLSLLIIPHCAQVNEHYLSKMHQIGAQLDEMALNLNYPLLNQLKTDFKGIEIINPQSVFKAKDRPEKRLYYENDPHLNSYGQTELANVLQKVLQGENYN